MKLTKDNLRSLIKEVTFERQKSSMILSETPPDTEDPLPSDVSRKTYDRIIDVLEGRDPSVETIVIMSGQNPMAQETDAAKNAMLDNRLKKDLTSMNLQFIPVGGKFDNDEDSVLIMNPSRAQAESLNRKYNQWGYVWGEKLPNFQMIQVDYDKDQGEFQAPGSKVTTFVIKDKKAQLAQDNYTFDYESGLKFLIPLY